MKEDFFYKGKPYPNDLPAWFTTIRLSEQDLTHLKTHKNQRINKQELRFSHEISNDKINGELARKIAMDCSKRCTFSYKGPIDEQGMPVP